MTVPWHVNEGLAPLVAEMRTAHPGIVIGTIGDAAHAGTVSDHNPNQFGRVNAADFMLGPAFGETDALALLPFLIADKRTHYVIHDRQIWTSEVPRWVAYNGSDPHTNHIHISVHDSAYLDPAPWTISGDDMNLSDHVINPGNGKDYGELCGVLATLMDRTDYITNTQVSNLSAAVATLENDVETIRLLLEPKQ